MRRSLVSAALLFFAVAFAAGTAAGQPRPPQGRRPPPVRAGSAASSQAASSRSLASRVGLEAAKRLLVSPSRESRLRGIRRIASLNDVAAVQLLARTLEEDALMASDDRLRLEAVRALAPFAARDPVRSQLVRFVLDEGGSGAVQQGSGLLRLAREEAAFALAAADDARVTEILVSMLLSGSSSGELASHALQAHPPSNLDPLLSTRALASLPVLHLLGSLGDLRALPKLRFVVDKGDIAVRAAAAIALARLGDEYAVKTSRGWMNQAGTSTSIREAATQALVLSRAADAPRAVAILLADPATRAAALRLAFDAPTPQLSPSLAGFLTIASPAERPATLIALARSGGPVATKTLRKQMGPSKTPDSDAVFALAHCAGESARAELGSLLAVPSARRLGARAAMLRSVVLQDPPSQLEPLLRSLLVSRDPLDRQVAAFGLALTGASTVASLLASGDEPVLRGACRASWGVGKTAREACAAMLRDSTPRPLRDSLAQALGGDVLPTNVSTHVLLAWAEQSDAFASIFARALGSRDSESYRPRIRQLLAAGDPVLRAQMALGLAFSPSPSAVSLLTEAYWFETDVAVRRAVIQALSGSSAPQRVAVLKSAALLDPDDETRETARLALAGAKLHRPVAGPRLAWISLASNLPSPPPAVLGRGALVVPKTGFAVGAVADDDGFLLVPGLPAGELRVLLAPSTASVQATP